MEAYGPNKIENGAEKTEFLDIRNVVKKLGLVKQYLNAKTVTRRRNAPNPKILIS